MPLLPDPLRLPAALSAVLVLGLAVQIALPIPQDAGRPQVAPRSNVTPAAGPALSPGPLGGFAAILERPLFSADRTPGSQPGTAVAGQGQLVLAGVGSGPGGGSATLRTSDGGLQTLSVGQAAQGWRLVATSTSAAVLERNGLRQVLRLGVVAPPQPGAVQTVTTTTTAAAPPAVPPTFSVHGSR